MTVGLDSRAHDVEITIEEAPPGVDRACLVEIVKGAMKGVRYSPVKSECRYHMKFSVDHKSTDAA
jgi:hypothetical protein